MIVLALALALASHASDVPPITCKVIGKQIVISFNWELYFRKSVDKFAVVQGEMMRGGEWLYVIDDQGSPLRFSPYRAGMKRLVVDTRRQHAVRYDKNSGKARIVRAFPGPGLYTLVFADNLGVDYQDMISWECRVRIRR